MYNKSRDLLVPEKDEIVIRRLQGMAGAFRDLINLPETIDKAVAKGKVGVN